jgi:hypothetical protein
MTRRVREQRVAIRRSFRSDPGTHRAAGSTAVVDHDLLTPGFVQSRSNQPRGDVGLASGSEGHQNAHGLRGVILSLRTDCRAPEQGNREANDKRVFRRQGIPPD